jgi:hypothetical protein
VIEKSDARYCGIKGVPQESPIDGPDQDRIF